MLIGSFFLSYRCKPRYSNIFIGFYLIASKELWHRREQLGGSYLHPSSGTTISTDRKREIVFHWQYIVIFHKKASASTSPSWQRIRETRARELERGREQSIGLNCRRAIALSSGCTRDSLPWAHEFRTPSCLSHSSKRIDRSLRNVFLSHFFSHVYSFIIPMQWITRKICGKISMSHKLIQGFGNYDFARAQIIYHYTLNWADFFRLVFDSFTQRQWKY